MTEKYELLIAEKPTSAKKIAEALADENFQIHPLFLIEAFI